MEDRTNLLGDVHFLIKNKLRQYLKVHRNQKPTRESIADIALSAVNNNQALSSLSGKKHLVQYLELYMVKLLGNVR